MRWGVLALVLAASSCGSSRSSVVKPDEMSAAEHRREAARERALAEQDYQRYQPTAMSPMGGVSAPADGPRLYPIDAYRFNPTDKALAEAERHLRHARQHEAAAAELEHFEAAECKELSPAMRAACPLLGPVQTIDDLGDGVRIRYAVGTPIAPVLAHMRCHLAFARARGWTDGSACPLYMKGVTIAASSDGAAIDVRSDDASVAREIQVRSRISAR